MKNREEHTKNREELFRSRHPLPPTEDVTERLVAQREDEVLSHTSSRLDDYISIGMATISDLRAQRGALKSTQRRLFDATASLGVSRSLMRIIGQRSSQERVIFYAGVVVTLIVIVLLWRWF